MSAKLDRNEVFGVKAGIVVETKDGLRPDRGHTAKVINKTAPPKGAAQTETEKK